MKQSFLCLLLWLSVMAVASAQSIFSDGFEGPVYAPGGANGQGGWSAQFGFNSISTAQAHSGTQSFLANGAGGSHPFDGPSFEMNISYGNDFWLETWVYVVAGPGNLATFGVATGLGPAFSFGIYDDGRVAFNSGQTVMNLGSVVLDQWVRLRIEHFAPTQQLVMSITGANVNQTVSGAYFGASQQSVIFMDARPDGHAYFDDMRAAYGLAAVPEPATVSLLSLGALGLLAVMRRRS